MNGDPSGSGPSYGPSNNGNPYTGVSYGGAGNEGIEFQDPANDAASLAAGIWGKDLCSETAETALVCFCTMEAAFLLLLAYLKWKWVGKVPGA